MDLLFILNETRENIKFQSNDVKLLNVFPNINKFQTLSLHLWNSTRVHRIEHKYLSTRIPIEPKPKGATIFFSPQN